MISGGKEERNRPNDDADYTMGVHEMNMMR